MVDRSIVSTAFANGSKIKDLESLRPVCNIYSLIFLIHLHWSIASKSALKAESVHPNVTDIEDNLRQFEREKKSK